MGLVQRKTLHRLCSLVLVSFDFSGILECGIWETRPDTRQALFQVKNEVYRVRRLSRSA